MMSPELNTVLAGLEGERQDMLRHQRGVLRGAVKPTVVGLAVAALALYLFLVGKGQVAIVVAVAGGFILMLVLIIASTLYSEPGDKISRKFKQTVLPLLAREIDPSLTYRETARIPESEFKATGLYPKVDMYSGHDLFSGRIGETDIRFSLVDAEEAYETVDVRTGPGGKVEIVRRIEYRTLFSGLFFSADFNKHFAGSTQIWSGEAGFLDEMRDGHVELESPDFDNAFKVRSTDQVEARYLLTLSLMEKLLALRGRYGPFNAAFSGGRLALLITTPLTLFAPDLDKPMDAAQVEPFRARLREITGLVEYLDLNTRIWSKGGEPVEAPVGVAS